MCFLSRGNGNNQALEGVVFMKLWHLGEDEGVCRACAEFWDNCTCVEDNQAVAGPVLRRRVRYSTTKVVRTTPRLDLAAEEALARHKQFARDVSSREETPNLNNARIVAHS